MNEQFTLAGLTVKIEQDSDAESPDSWGDDGLFLVANHRDFYVKPPKAKGSTFETVVSDYEKTHHVFPLEAYIHGGVMLALGHEGNFPDRQWDVSQLGAVFIAKSEAKTKAQARKLALGLIETWNQYLAGDVYYYTVTDEKGDTLDSCGGFYGLEDCKSEAQSSAEHLAKERREKAIAKRKAEIKNRVPLDKRSAKNI